jgi:hypothetical protein
MPQAVLQLAKCQQLGQLARYSRQTLTKEALLKGKAQYSRPPCTK